jgi:hypothetical protein
MGIMCQIGARESKPAKKSAPTIGAINSFGIRVEVITSIALVLSVNDCWIGARFAAAK